MFALNEEAVHLRASRSLFLLAVNVEGFSRRLARRSSSRCFSRIFGEQSQGYKVNTYVIEEEGSKRVKNAVLWMLKTMR